MKRIAFLIVVFCFFQNAQSQIKSSDDLVVVKDNGNIYNTASVEIKPEFPGGMNEFYSFISKNFKLPNNVGFKGKILVAFVVDIDGTLTDIKVVKDAGYETAQEVIRLLSASPKWLPAELNRKKVRCSYMLPINIEISK